MMLKPFLSLIMLFILSFGVEAQQTCGTSSEDMMAFRKKFGSDFMKEHTDTVSIAVQVIVIGYSPEAIPGYVTNESIAAEIESLDTVFNSIGVHFEMCHPPIWLYDKEIGGSTIKQHTGYLLSRYKTPGMLTIFMSHNAGGAAAYAVPSQHYIASMMSTFFSTGLIHEIGHMFGLPHTHETGNGKELVNGSNCTVAGDLICDTPADPRLSGYVNENCEYTGQHVDPNGDLYSPMVNNYMAYSPGKCRNAFTSGQKEVMRGVVDQKIEQGHYLPCDGGPALCISSDTIDNCQGWLHDGSGAAPYDNNISCRYILRSDSENGVMKLTFESFDTEEDQDILYIYDGIDTNAPLLLAHSGTSIPDMVTASGPEVLLVFETNETGTGQGWFLEYDCFEGSDLEILLPFNQFYTMEESDVIIDATITNNGNRPSLPCISYIRINELNYLSNGADTTIYVTVPAVMPGDTISQVTRLNLCPLEAKCNSSGRYFLDYFLDYNNSNNEHSRANNFEIDARISDVDPVCTDCTPGRTLTACIDSLEDGSGPNQRYEANLDCSWKINTDQEGKMMIYFRYAEISQSTSSSTGDSLVIYDGPDANSPVLATIQGWSYTDTLYTSGNEAFLHFVTDSHNTGSGAKGGWKLIYECSNPTGIPSVQNNVIGVWPNPSPTGTFKISGMVQEPMVLYNQLGKTIQIIHPGTKEFTVLNRGLYFLRTGNEVKKLVY